MQKHASALFIESFEPQCYRDALASPQAEKWLSAFQDEYNFLIKNETWDLVPLPQGCSTIDCKMIGKVKPGYEGAPERYKGRLVAIGSRQKYGVDYDETFAPVPHNEAVKATLEEIASLYLEMIQFDISNPFLYAKLDKPIYMKQPGGFSGKNGSSCPKETIKYLFGFEERRRGNNKLP